MLLRNKAAEIIEGAKGLFNRAMAQADFLSTLKHMDKDEFDMLQKSLELLNTGEEVTLEVFDKIDKIDSIEKKLDDLLRNQKELKELIKDYHRDVETIEIRPI